MVDNNCYALEAKLSSVPTRTEFGLEPTRAWLAELRNLKLQNAVAQLIVKLDRMSRVAMPVSERRSLLRELQRPLSKAAAALPKAVEGERGQDQGDGYTLLLEQRLYCLMVKNLKQLLKDLDSSMNAYSTVADKRRRWALRRLFHFLGKQIELGLLRGFALPRYSWRELHDLYDYALARGIVRVRGKVRLGGRDSAFDPEREYKRLLLLGLAGRLVQNRPWSEFVQDRIEFWVGDTSLEHPDAFVGEFDLYVVEKSKDSPPRQLQGQLTDSFAGWVLLRPSGFLSDEVAVPQPIPAAEPIHAGRFA